MLKRLKSSQFYLSYMQKNSFCLKIKIIAFVAFTVVLTWIFKNAALISYISFEHACIESEKLFNYIRYNLKIESLC